MTNQYNIPAGWKLVPVELTQEMHDAASDNFIAGDTIRVEKLVDRMFKAMLAAAPPPPEPPFDTLLVTVKLLQEALAVMRECGWKTAYLHPGKSDGILSAAASEIEQAFSNLLERQMMPLPPPPSGKP